MNLKTLKISFSLLIIVLMTSCYSTKQMNVAVTKNITEEINKNTQVIDTNVIIKTDNLKKIIPSANVSSIYHYFIPAIFYWETRNEMKIELNSRAYINYFTDAVNNKIIENNFGEKFKGLKLEISLDEVPNEFIYKFDDVVLFLVFAYAHYYYEDFFTKDQQIKVSYRVLKDNQQIKTGNFQAPFLKEKVTSGISLDSAVEKYVKENRANFMKASETLVQLVINEM